MNDLDGCGWNGSGHYDLRLATPRGWRETGESDRVKELGKAEQGRTAHVQSAKNEQGFTASRTQALNSMAWVCPDGRNPHRNSFLGSQS